MLYAAIDIHKQAFQAAVLDPESGEVVADFASCLARPDLVERRMEWPVALRLKPLRDSDVDELIPELLRGDLRERIARASGGNPLFVAEIVAMAEATEGELAVPPTLQALLAARIDQL